MYGDCVCMYILTIYVTTTITPPLCIYMTGGEVQCRELLRGWQPLLSQRQARARSAVLPTRHQARCPVCVLIDVMHDYCIVCMNIV